jgi:hypothetical protein
VRSGARALRAIGLEPPAGLAFVRAKAGVTVLGSGHRATGSKASVSHGVLTIAFVSAQRTAQVTIAYPALAASAALASKVRHRKLHDLRISLTATDTAHTTNKLTLELTAVT